MPKFTVRVPVNVWMDMGEVEASDFDEAMDKAYDDPTPYPKLCDVCAKRFKLSEPDETGVDVYLKGEG